MATAVIVKKIVDIGDPQYETNIYEVEIETGQKFKVKAGNFENNYAVTVQAYVGMPIQEIAEIIEGCFLKGSNFFKDLSKYFKCNRLVRLDYKNVTTLINYQKISAPKIVSSWKRQAKLLQAGIYYVVGVRKLRSCGEYDGICFVLAATEKEAIRKAKRGYDSCECVCIGKYNQIEDTFLLNNAHSYLKNENMHKIYD